MSECRWGGPETPACWNISACGCQVGIPPVPVEIDTVRFQQFSPQGFMWENHLFVRQADGTFAEVDGVTYLGGAVPVTIEKVTDE